MGIQHAIAIELGRRTVRAVQVSHARGAGHHGGVAIERAIVAEIPAHLQSSADPAALGSWLGERLTKAGIRRGRALLALPRELVGLKRMTLPTIDDAELPEMTRLAMQRELPFDAQGMVIDFVPQERGPISATVLAVALPQTVLDSMRSVLQHAGMTAGRIALTTMGAAELALGCRPSAFGARRSSSREPDSPLADNGKPAAESLLIIDISGDAIELCITVDGHIRFSRAAELPVATDRAAIAEAVITEARRTWTSYRTAEDAMDLTAAVLVGDPQVCDLASEALTEILRVRPAALKNHPRIDASGIRDPDRIWPLAGLLLESNSEKPLIDLGVPRRAPDLAAQVRKRRLLIAAAALIGCGAIFTLANMHLKSLRARAESLASAQRTGVADFERYRRDAAKLEHLRQWETSQVDWLTHANYLMNFSPPPDQVVLDSWSGTIDPVDVRYDSRSMNWITPRSITIVMDGEARDRETADAFREALVKRSAYTTSSTGADAKGGKRLPWGFTYRLRLSGGLPASAINSGGEPAPAQQAGHQPQESAEKRPAS